MVRANLLAVALVVGCFFSGCASVKTKPELEKPIDPSATSFLLEVRPSGGKTQKKQVGLNGNLWLQDVIDQSGVGKQFGRIKIVVYRKRQRSLGFVKLKSEYRNGKVNPVNNFAIHSGDRVVLIQDDSTVLDDLMDTFKGPLGSL